MFILSMWLFLYLPFSLAQKVKRLSAMRETCVRSLGQEDPLEKEMATHSSTLAWKIPWMEEPDRLHSLWGHRVGHDGATSLSLFFTSPSASFPLPVFCPLILSHSFSFHFSLCPSIFSYVPINEKDVCLIFPVSWLVWSWQWASFQPSPSSEPFTQPM